MCLREKIGPDPRNFNQRVSLGRNDLLIRTFPSALKKEYQTFEGIQDVNTSCFREKWKRLPIH